MAAQRTGATLEVTPGSVDDLTGNIPKRHARVTVKYNRKGLQRRLDVETWIEDSLDQLFEGQVGQNS